MSVTEPARMALTTCDEASYFRAGIALYDAAPWEGGRLLAVHEPDMPCGTLYYAAMHPRAFWVVVDGDPRAFGGADATYPTSEYDATAHSGLFRLTATCEILRGTPPEAHCANEYVTCGELLEEQNNAWNGTHYPSHMGSAAGDWIGLLAVFAPTRLTLSTCLKGTNFDTAVYVFDGAPSDARVRVVSRGERERYNGTMIARSVDTVERESGTCSMLSVDLEAAGSYHVVVTGAGAEQHGLFDLSVGCADFELYPPSECQGGGECGTKLSRAPCNSAVIGCGEAVRGSTVGLPSFVGSSAPDMIYQIAVFEAADVVATLCSPLTSFAGSLRLYETFPSPDADFTLLARSDPVAPCATLFFDTALVSSYWLAVDGARDGEEGIFELSVGCERLSALPQESTCAWRYLACGEEVLGTTQGYGDRTGVGTTRGEEQTGEAMFLLSLFEPTRLAISACSERTTFPVRLSLFAGAMPVGNYSHDESGRRGNATALVAESEPGQPCAMHYDALPGDTFRSLWLVVEGATPGT
jgi:hypothetical protein